MSFLPRTPVRLLCAASLAWASVAVASQEPAPAAAVTVNGWTISDQRGQCSAETRQSGNLVAEIVHHAGSRETTLLLRQPSWAAIRERNGDAVSLRFSNGRTYEGMARAGRPSGRRESRITTIAVSSEGGALLDDFARAHRIDVSIGGVRAGAVSLRGTLAVAERLRSCAAASFRNYPPPHVVPIPGAPTHQPGPRPPVQRSGGIMHEDYPAAAIRAGEQGIVRLRLTVSPQGRVTGCAIMLSSGYASLDSASCSIAQRRFQFEPARDAAGNAVEGIVTRAVIWRLPELPPPLPDPRR